MNWLNAKPLQQAISRISSITGGSPASRLIRRTLMLNRFWQFPVRNVEEDVFNTSQFAFPVTFHCSIKSKGHAARKRIDSSTKAQLPHFTWATVLLQIYDLFRAHCSPNFIQQGALQKSNILTVFLEMWCYCTGWRRGKTNSKPDNNTGNILYRPPWIQIRWWSLLSSKGYASTYDYYPCGKTQSWPEFSYWIHLSWYLSLVRD